MFDGVTGASLPGDGDLSSETNQSAEFLTICWPGVFAAVRQGDVGAAVLLRQRLYNGIRYLVSRVAIPNEVEAISLEILTKAVKFVEKGRVVTIEDLLIRIRESIQSRVAAPETPQHAEQLNEPVANPKAKTALLSKLRGMSERDRAAITRFYMDGITPAEVCQEFQMSEDTFRELQNKLRKAYVATAGAH